MPQVTIPEGIVRSLTLVTADDGVVAIFVDGIRKIIGVEYDDEETQAVELIDLLCNEGFSSKVIHIQRYTCNTFYRDTCLSDPGIFLDICPELLQHLKVDQD